MFRLLGQKQAEFAQPAILYCAFCVHASVNSTNVGLPIFNRGLRSNHNVKDFLSKSTICVLINLQTSNCNDVFQCFLISMRYLQNLVRSKIFELPLLDGARTP